MLSRRQGRVGEVLRGRGGRGSGGRPSAQSTSCSASSSTTRAPSAASSLVGQRDAQAQAGRAAAVVHRLAHVEVVHRAHRVAARPPPAPGRRARGASSRASFGATMAMRPVGQGEHLGVEGVGRHRLRHRQLGLVAPPPPSPSPSALPQLVCAAPRRPGRPIRAPEEPRLAHRQHVGVEGAGVDAGGVLLRKEAARRGRAGAGGRASGWPRASAGPGSAGAATAPQALRPQPKRCTAPREVSRRVWLAAPSSAKWPPPGSGSCTAKCAASAKMARSTAWVVSASMARWNMAGGWPA